MSFSKELVNFPGRYTYGVKREQVLSKHVVDKIHAISEQAKRPAGIVYSFCIKHAIFIGAYDRIPFGYTISKNKASLGVRVPRSWLDDLRDLAWRAGVTQPSLCTYLCTYSLSGKTVEEWSYFFYHGYDISYDLWMYMEKPCQNLNLSSQELKNLTTQLNQCKTFSFLKTPQD